LSDTFFLNFLTRRSTRSNGQRKPKHLSCTSVPRGTLETTKRMPIRSWPESRQRLETVDCSSGSGNERPSQSSSLSLPGISLLRGCLAGSPSSQSSGEGVPSPSRSAKISSPARQSSSIPFCGTSTAAGWIAGAASLQSAGRPQPSWSASRSCEVLASTASQPETLSIVSAITVSAPPPQAAPSGAPSRTSRRSAPAPPRSTSPPVPPSSVAAIVTLFSSVSVSKPPAPRITIAVVPASGQAFAGQPAPAATLPLNVMEAPDWLTVTVSLPPSPSNVITVPAFDTVPADATPGTASSAASTSSASLSTASPSSCPRGTSASAPGCRATGR
jgi:hypothetical protein